MGGNYKKPGTPETAHVIVTEENQKVWNRPVGTQVYMETGCNVPLAVMAGGYRSAVLNSVKTIDPETELYSWKGRPLMGHLTNSRLRPYNDNSDSIKWLKAMKGLAELNGVTLEI